MHHHDCLRHWRVRQPLRMLALACEPCKSEPRAPGYNKAIDNRRFETTWVIERL